MKNPIPPRICLIANILAFSMASTASAADPKVETFTALEIIKAVVAEQDAREGARRACSERALELVDGIVDGTLDPEQSAIAAADMGCFGMITDLSSIPSGTPYALGLECRPNFPLFMQTRLRLLEIPGGNDLISQDREVAEHSEFREKAAAYRTFALKYNAALFAHPMFPYKDLCRRVDPDYRPQMEVLLGAFIAGWGFRQLEEIHDPIDVYQAARRGSLKSLQRLIEEDPLNVHIPDIVGLTPLAWAVIYDRPEQTQLLIANGAHPYGEPFRTQPTSLSPFTIARFARNRELIEIMQPAVEARKLSIPILPAKLNEQFSTIVDTDGKMLELKISVEGKVTDCHVKVGNTLNPYPLMCAKIENSLIYFPAEKGSGDPIASTVSYSFRKSWKELN